MEKWQYTVEKDALGYSLSVTLHLSNSLYTEYI